MKISRVIISKIFFKVVINNSKYKEYNKTKGGSISLLPLTYKLEIIILLRVLRDSLLTST